MTGAFVESRSQRRPTGPVARLLIGCLLLAGCGTGAWQRSHQDGKWGLGPIELSRTSTDEPRPALGAPDETEPVKLRLPHLGAVTVHVADNPHVHKPTRPSRTASTRG